jgi:hypothetical protein
MKPFGIAQQFAVPCKRRTARYSRRADLKVQASAKSMGEAN